MLMARAKPRHTNRDGNRASDVIARLRALFSKKPLTLGPLDLNQAMAQASRSLSPSHVRPTTR
jgi:hypothetical protein